MKTVNLLMSLWSGGAGGDVSTVSKQRHASWRPVCWFMCEHRSKHLNASLLLLSCSERLEQVMLWIHHKSFWHTALNSWFSQSATVSAATPCDNLPKIFHFCMFCTQRNVRRVLLSVYVHSPRTDLYYKEKAETHKIYFRHYRLKSLFKF